MFSLNAAISPPKITDLPYQKKNSQMGLNAGFIMPMTIPTKELFTKNCPFGESNSIRKLHLGQQTPNFYSTFLWRNLNDFSNCSSFNIFMGSQQPLFDSH